MNRNKLIYLVVFTISFLSLFFVKGINSYFTKKTEPLINRFSIQKNTSYTVVHEVMDLNGNYVEHHRDAYSNVPIGTVVSPDLLSPTDLPREGFDLPQTQTVTLNSFNDTVITYRYTRKQYTLTIENNDYITTTTPSGTYYYGTEIHLIADPNNNEGYPFAKWTDDCEDRDYTFTLTDNTTIGPIYDYLYVITFEPNNGDPQTTKEVLKTQAIGTMPSLKDDDCVGESGDYIARQCTYYNSLEGWYKEPTFEIKVDENFVPTEDMTLYAKWQRLYQQQAVFDGTNYIDTGVQLFSEENIDKNFEISFDIDNVEAGQTELATIINSMLEVSPYPGFVFRIQTDGTSFTFNAPKIANKTMKINSTNRIVLKRILDVYYIQINDGELERINTYSGTTFNINTTIGASLDANGNPYRYFIGTLSNITIILNDIEKYSVIFDANGGTGTMTEQLIRKDEEKALNQNEYEKEGKMLDHWNTKADGTGTSYGNKEVVTNLTTPGDEITLYAIWKDPIHYYVRFNANGGTGVMIDQDYTYTISQNLSTNLFTREGYVFCGWNTEPDGTGTFYNKNQSVKNLTETENGIVDLYAVWEKAEYEYSGEYVFDGTNYIDTGIHLFSEETLDQDFDISFEIVERVSTGNQATMMSAMDEKGSPWPGIVYRVQSSTQDNICANATSSVKLDRKINKNNKVVLKRRSGILYVSYNDGDEEQLLDMTSLTTPFDVPVTFGSSLNGSGNPQRYFKGTLKNMSVKLYE